MAERKLGGTARREKRFTRIGEIPFTSARKMMSTIEADHDDNPVVITKGAPGVPLARCTQVRVGSATVALDSAMRKRILADVATLADARARHPEREPWREGGAGCGNKRGKVHAREYPRSKQQLPTSA